MTEPEHAALADGTVLRDLTWRQLTGLRWDSEEGRAYEVIADDDLPDGVERLRDLGPVTGNA